ncbi:hypothetical protein NDK25_21880 [Niallia taxi]|nr:hypothetical protein [Niallia taxi]MDE5054867.1 hypothetical protein [Niallia taxi]
MPYFEAKKRTVYSPENSKLEILFNFLEKHNQSLSGSDLYNDLVDIYENLDEEMKEESK